MDTLLKSLLTPYSLVAYGLIVAWIINSSYLILKLWKTKDIHSVNLYIYESIPSVFTTFGVFGTFLGIFFGLWEFDVNNITESIPALLQGLKTAFLTSIVGIALSLVSARISKIVLRRAEKEHPDEAANELTALNHIAELISNANDQMTKNFESLKNALIGETDHSIGTQITKIRNQLNEAGNISSKQYEVLEKVQVSLGGDKETSLLTQIQKLRAEQSEYAKESNNHLKGMMNTLGSSNGTNILEHIHQLRTEQSESMRNADNNLKAIMNALGSSEETSLLVQIQQLREDQSEYSIDTRKNIEWIVESMSNNSKIIHGKFDEFAELLAKNNTEALVEVMKAATEQFNAQMSELINKLVQENFQELNNSVKMLNTWQQENKVMIQQLTNQFKQVSDDFVITSIAIEDITKNTSQLTDDNSHLTRLIKELQEVMINDTKFKEITKKIADTVDILHENTEAFDETTNKLNTWVKNQMNFSDSVAVLLSRLEQIDKIKDINEVFWNNTKKQLTEGVNLIGNASTTLRNDLDAINQQFYEQLNDTFQNLDTLIQRIIVNYRRA